MKIPARITMNPAKWWLNSLSRLSAKCFAVTAGSFSAAEFCMVIPGMESIAFCCDHAEEVNKNVKQIGRRASNLSIQNRG
jgi:hypothetical protein